MKSLGGTIPSSGCSQRTSASAPRTLVAVDRDDRLIVENELLGFERLREIH